MNSNSIIKTLYHIYYHQADMADFNRLCSYYENRGFYLHLRHPTYKGQHYKASKNALSSLGSGLLHLENVDLLNQEKAHKLQLIRK